MTTRERHLLGRDYRLMVSALAAAAKHRDAELANAEQAYRDSAGQAAGALARAEAEAVAADRWAGTAAAAVLDVDREAARLWGRLRLARGMRARTLGDLPDPAPVEGLSRMAVRLVPNTVGDRHELTRTLLTAVADMIDDTVRRVPRRPPPRWLLPLLPLAGALVSAATGLVAAGLVTFGEADVAAGPLLRGLGWLTFLVAPSAGVPVAAYCLHRMLNARLDVGGVGLTLLGGMVAATVLSLTFASR